MLSDKKDIFNLFLEAAEQGHVDAQYALGRIYSDGAGVIQDKKEAVKWYRKSAEQGHAIAQKNLDFILKLG